MEGSMTIDRKVNFHKWNGLRDLTHAYSALKTFLDRYMLLNIPFVQVVNLISHCVKLKLFIHEPYLRLWFDNAILKYLFI
jgi:hypothetical protein